jgi:hypothetical protein
MELDWRLCHHHHHHHDETRLRLLVLIASFSNLSSSKENGLMESNFFSVILNCFMLVDKHLIEKGVHAGALNPLMIGCKICCLSASPCARSMSYETL